MRNYDREYELEKTTIDRIVIKVDKETANKFKKLVKEEGETVQGHLKKYINDYITSKALN